jgi:GDPmannose 4,6-dehydratase
MEHVFSYLGLDWQQYYSVDPRFNRPADPTGLLGDSRKAKQKLGWEAKTPLKELARIMVEYDLQTLQTPEPSNP